MNDFNAGLETIRELEALRTKCLLEQDFDTFQGLCDERLVYTHSVGFRDNRATLLNLMQSGALVYHSIHQEFDEVELAEDLLWASGRMTTTLTGGGRKVTTESFTTMVWRRHEDEWRLLAFHATSEKEQHA